MVSGKVEMQDRLAWNHTSSMMGLIHNCHAKKPVKFDYYNPYITKKSGGIPIKAKDIGVLKQFAHNLKESKKR